jgi:hypothetical protein
LKPADIKFIKRSLTAQELHIHHKQQQELQNQQKQQKEKEKRSKRKGNKLVACIKCSPVHDDDDDTDADTDADEDASKSTVATMATEETVTCDNEKIKIGPVRIKNIESEIKCMATTGTEHHTHMGQIFVVSSTIL